jgi:hypothetical protein
MQELPGKRTRYLPERQDKSTSAKMTDYLNSLPPFVTLLQAAQGSYATEPIGKLAADTTAYKLSGKTGAKRAVGRVMTEGPMAHDLGLTALKQLSPDVDPKYRTNKVGEQLILGGGNFAKDQLMGLLLSKGLPGLGSAITNPVVKQGIKQAEKSAPMTNLVTDPMMYKQLLELAGFLQKGRPELGGKSYFQAIPGFENYLNDLAKKDIAKKPAVAGSKKMLDAGEHYMTQPHWDETTLALMKILQPVMQQGTEIASRFTGGNPQSLPDTNIAPPMESTNYGQNLPKFDAFQYKPAMQGDYYNQQLGLTNAQNTGWDILKLMQALEYHQEDLAKHPATQELVKAMGAIGSGDVGQIKDLLKGYGSVVKNAFFPRPSARQHDIVTK